MDRKKILLADDVELFIQLEKSFFRRGDFDLLVARNGAEALAIARAERPDLILMDLYMPEMNGNDCCRQIKNDPELATIPIIMVTHGGREADLELCRQAGCDAILLKPIMRHDFLATTRKFLELEERAAPRYDARIRVHYGPPPQELLQNYSVNLSTGGMFLETEQAIPVDTPLNLEFFLDETCIRCRARVAWANAPELILKPQLPAGVGLQFIDVTLDQLHAIRKFIEEKVLSPTG